MPCATVQDVSEKNRHPLGPSMYCTYITGNVRQTELIPIKLIFFIAASCTLCVSVLRRPTVVGGLSQATHEPIGRPSQRHCAQNGGSILVRRGEGKELVVMSPPHNLHLALYCARREVA